MRKDVLKSSDLRLYKKLESENKCDDTRYYGVFIKSDKTERRIKVDTVRFNKFFHLSESQLAEIKNMGTHYFGPSKRHWKDYSCNVFVDCINEISKEWNDDFLPMVKRTISEIKPKELGPADLELFNCGIIDHAEATMTTNIENIKAQMAADRKRQQLWLSLYAQFFHQMASKIEAITINVLTKNGWQEKNFSRNVFYNFKNIKETEVKSLKSFDAYNKLYAIWNFLKHNSLSTYEALKNSYPEAMIEADRKYAQGELALFYINFDETLINTLLSGLKEFFIEYCNLALGENYESAQWNYNDWFLEKVNDEIESITNPLGLPPWI